MPNYHVAANGNPAICKAQPGACPLGGRHGTRAAIDFYIETQQMLGLTPAGSISAHTAAPRRSVGVAMALLSNEDVTKRLKALNSFETAEKSGDEEAINDAAQKLENMGEDVADPTWHAVNLQREHGRRRSDIAGVTSIAA